MNRIDALFTRLKTEGRRALMPFITAGIPTCRRTAALITELVRCGAHMVEIGIPYSDPIADGPVIAASYHRALRARGQAGAHLRRRSGRSGPRPPAGRCRSRRWSTMVSYAIIHRREWTSTSARRSPPGSTA